MRAERGLRILLILAILLAFLLVLAAALFFTEKLLVVWGHLREAPAAIFYPLVVLFTVLAVGGGWIVARFLMPRRRALPARNALDATDPETLLARMDAAENRGVDVSDARRELERLAHRQAAGDLYVALFGEVSAGKSSLIRALLPESDAVVSVEAGSTREVTHYTWTSPAGDRLILSDLPGLHEPGDGRDPEARAEALRAQVAVYVCDGDLTNSQYQELEALLVLGKPVVVALNKADRYTDADLKKLRERIVQRVERALGAAANSAGAQIAAEIDVVAISAGGVEVIVRVDADGSETRVERPRNPQVEALARALQWRIDRAPEALDRLRDAAVFNLVSSQLNEAESAFRAAQAQSLVKDYTRKAVVGALAAVAPGTDLLIQGYLGASLVREMCALYDAPVRDIDVQQFLEISQRQVSRAVPLLMAVTGNAFKAFPGLGTVAGGLLHAVAYGLIFDALGHSLADTLAQGGLLRPVPAAQRFRENLSGDLETRTKRIARLALEAARKPDDD